MFFLDCVTFYKLDRISIVQPGLGPITSDGPYVSVLLAGRSKDTAILEVVSVDAGDLKICCKTTKRQSLSCNILLTLTLLKNATILDICKILVLAIIYV